MWKHGFRHIEKRENVSTECSLKLFRTDIKYTFLRMLFCRIINQDIHFSELSDDLLY